MPVAMRFRFASPLFCAVMAKFVSCLRMFCNSRYVAAFPLNMALSISDMMSVISLGKRGAKRPLGKTSEKDSRSGSR